MLKFVLITLFIALASAKEFSIAKANAGLQGRKAGSTFGIVSPVDRCGGRGEPLEFRIEGCTGAPPCSFSTGTEYDLEGDFIPHQSSNGVNLKLIINVGGIQAIVFDVPVEGEIIEGERYTASYPFTPAAALAGQRIIVEIQVYQTVSQDIEICLSAPGIVT